MKWFGKKNDKAVDALRDICRTQGKLLQEADEENEKAAEKILELQAVIDAGGRRFLIHVPRLERSKQAEVLGVPDTDPMLLAFLDVIRDEFRGATAAAAEPFQKDVKPGYYDGAIGALMELQENLLEIVEEGRAMKAGQKSEARGQRSGGVS